MQMQDSIFDLHKFKKIPLLNLAAQEYYDMAPIIEKVLGLFS